MAKKILFEKGGVFCEMYGETVRNRILEHILALSDTDFAAVELYDMLGISKPMIYSVLTEFLKKGYIIKTRVIGKTQLYTLNKDNKISQIFLKNFDECLKLAGEEYSKKPSQNISQKQESVPA